MAAELKLSHTAEGEGWRKLIRLEPGDPARKRIEGEIQLVMDRQRDLMALRAKVPLLAPVSETPPPASSVATNSATRTCSTRCASRSPTSRPTLR